MDINSTDFLQQLKAGTYDFLDLGCSNGGSIDFAVRQLGGKRGAGVDIDPAKVALARAAGHEAYVADALSLGTAPKAVEFVTMLDFLEHLPGYEAARRCIAAAYTLSRSFVFIRQPWFDADGYLLAHGLKLYWSDWTGHTNAMSSLQFHNILSRMRSPFRIYGRGRITNSTHPAVHSLSSPIDQHDWQADKHPPKPHVEFERPVYQQIACLIARPGCDFMTIEGTLPPDDLIVDGQHHGR